MSSNRILSFLKRKFPANEENLRMNTFILLDGQQVNQITSEIKEYMEQFKSVEEFSMCNCHLNSLENLPQFANLKTLELNDNHIKGEELKKIVIYDSLEELKIANNPIENFDDINPLVNLKNLIILDLSETKLSQKENYRKKIFEMFPGLKYLDGTDKNGKDYEEIEEEDEEDENEENDEDKKFIDDRKEDEEENDNEVNQNNINREGLGLKEGEEEGDDEEDFEEEGEEFDEGEGGKEDEGEEEEDEGDEALKHPGPGKKRKTE